jgi:hypothetical protein
MYNDIAVINGKVKFFFTTGNNTALYNHNSQCINVEGNLNLNDKTSISTIPLPSTSILSVSIHHHLHKTNIININLDRQHYHGALHRPNHCPTSY